MLIKDEPKWNGTAGANLEIFPDFESLDDECPLPADDFLQALSSGLEIPRLLGGEGSPGHDESPDEIMKGATIDSIHTDFDEYGLNFIDFDDVFSGSDINMADDFKNVIKREPESPHPQLPPSPSPSHSESSGSEWQPDVDGTTAVGAKFTLETPPISPPQNESPPISPQPAGIPPPVQKFKLIPFNGSDAAIAAQFTLANEKSAKRVCVQPKIGKTISSNGVERPRKMIVLSAQDFAALTKKVKQNNSAQPLKINALARSKHVELQNSLNLQTSKISKPPTAIQIAQSNRVKIVNALPSVQIDNVDGLTKIPIAGIAKESAPMITPTEPRKPIIIKSEPTNCSGFAMSNEIPDLLDLAVRKECEMKAIKRQQRMIKNRESACLSRKKKKEYVTALEKQISDLQDENRRLRTENAALKQRLCATEETTGSGRKFGNFNPGANKKNTAILLAMIFMVSLNVTSFGGIMSPDKRQLEKLSSSISSESSPNVRHGRSLLWSEPETPDDDITIKDDNDTLPGHHPMCPMYINQTESKRLDNELRRLTGGDSDNENWTGIAQTEPKIGKLNKLLLTNKFRDGLNVRPKLKSEKSESRKNSANDASKNSNAVEVSSPILRDHASLFAAVGRRADTYYAIWFSDEYLLVPATTQNNTERPRMSLVVPELAVNESFTGVPGHVTMRRIDCEVTDTQELYIPESAIPEHLRGTKKASTARPNNPRADDAPMENSTNATKSYKPYFVKDIPVKSYNGSYALNNKDAYNVDVIASPEIHNDKFATKFRPDDDRYNSYETTNEEYVKTDVLGSYADGQRSADSRRGKKFRRRRAPANR